MTLAALEEAIATVVAYNLDDELRNVEEMLHDGAANPLEGHIATPLLALARFIGQEVTKTCPSCEDERPWETMLPGGACPHCGHVEPEESDE